MSGEGSEPEEVAKKSKRRWIRSSYGEPSSPVKLTEYVDRRWIAKAEERCGVRLGLILTASLTDPSYTYSPTPLPHGLRRPHGLLARPLPWSTACATRSCGPDWNAVAGSVSFKEIGPLLFPCFKFLILFSL
jgi:hypothetical protein